MASSEPSRKRGREEVPPPPPAEPEEVSPLPPEEVLPPPPAEVKPPPPEEVKQLKPPRHKVAWQPVVPLRAPKVNVDDAGFSVKMLHQAFLSLGKVVVHLRVQRPTDPLQMTVLDYAFKINVLAGELERGVLPPIYDDDGDDDGGLDVSSSGSGSGCGSDSDSDVGLLRRRLPLPN
jgi:hypothetical protein